MPLENLLGLDVAIRMGVENSQHCAALSRHKPIELGLHLWGNPKLRLWENARRARRELPGPLAVEPHERLIGSHEVIAAAERKYATPSDGHRHPQAHEQHGYPTERAKRRKRS